MSRTHSLVWAAALYSLGLAIVSLSPFTEWRYVPQAPWAYLLAPWPRYWTGFDLLVNVIAYGPLGLMVSRAAIARVRSSAWGPFIGFLAAALAGILLSLVLEGLQTYLPSRRPQLMDVMANGGGAMIGGFLASVYFQGRARSSWAPESRPIEVGSALLVGLWVVAQAAPQQVWLALGDIIPQASWRPVMSWFSIVHEQQTAALGGFAGQRVLAESLCVAATLLSLALMIHLSLLSSARFEGQYRRSHWMPTLVLTIVLGLCVRAVWVVLLSSPAALSAWLNAGVQAGIVLALLTGYGLAGLSPRQQRTAALMALSVTLILANTLPENDYTAAAFLAWSGGKWLNLQLLANLSAMVWPIAAMLWFGLMLHQGVFKKQPGPASENLLSGKDKIRP